MKWLKRLDLRGPLSRHKEGGVNLAALRCSGSCGILSRSKLEAKNLVYPPTIGRTYCSVGDLYACGFTIVGGPVRRALFDFVSPEVAIFSELGLLSLGERSAAFFRPLIRFYP